MANQDITIGQLRQLLVVEADLREKAENRWKNAQRELVSLLERVDPQEAERRLKNGLFLDNLGVEELVHLVIRPYNTLLRQAKAAQKETDCSSAIQPLLEEIQEKRRQIEKLQMEIGRMEEEELQSSRADQDGRQRPPTDLQHPPELTMQKPVAYPGEQTLSEPPFIKHAPEPDWLASWRKTDAFEREAAVLRLMGETGLARRPQIELRLGIREASGSQPALFNHMETLGLIEFFHSGDIDGAKTGGPAPDYVRVAERGRLAYMLLAGTSPFQSEYDVLLARHISLEHIQLYLQSADMLREASYLVNSSSYDILLPDGNRFKPDLLAFDPHNTPLYINVETEPNQNREQRLAKWRKALHVGGRKLYIVCDNQACMRSIRSEINFALGRQVVQCSLTNLADLQAGKRAVDGGIWLEVRLNPTAS